MAITMTSLADWRMIKAAAGVAGNVDLDDPSEQFMVRKLKSAVTYQDVSDLLEAENYLRMDEALHWLIGLTDKSLPKKYDKRPPRGKHPKLTPAIRAEVEKKLNGVAMSDKIGVSNSVIYI